jgi:hypothetical protein
MAFLSASNRLIRLFPGREPWAWQGFASSLAVHALGFALVGWATHGQFGTWIATSPRQAARADVVRYLVLDRPPTGPAPRHERRPPRPVGPVARVTPSATLPAGVSLMESSNQSAAPSAPSLPPLQTEALAPGATVGIGHVIFTTHSDSTGGRGLAGIFGFSGPATGVGPARRGLDQLAELVGGAGSACPELRSPAASAKPAGAVTVAFVVDTNGRVDRATLQVIESPGQPRTDHRFQARVYVVGSSLQVGSGRSPPSAVDSVLTEEVASHVAGLVFRPAMKEGRVVRSTVLVSCQTL